MTDQTKGPQGPGSPERSGSERSEIPRSGGDPGRAPRAASSNEVEPRPQRRTHSKDYKLRIVREADACRQPGEIGALLRREGLYSSHLVAWRRLRDQGVLLASGAPRRGPQAVPKNPLSGENEQLRRRVAQLESELDQSRALIEVQKKVAALLATLPSAAPRDGARS